MMLMPRVSDDRGRLLGLVGLVGLVGSTWHSPQQEQRQEPGSAHAVTFTVLGT